MEYAALPIHGIYLGNLSSNAGLYRVHVPDLVLQVAPKHPRYDVVRITWHVHPIEQRHHYLVPQTNDVLIVVERIGLAIEIHPSF